MATQLPLSFSAVRHAMGSSLDEDEDEDEDEDDEEEEAQRKFLTVMSPANRIDLTLHAVM